MSGPGVKGVKHSCFGLVMCSYSGGSSHNPRARVSSRLIKFDSDFMIPQKSVNNHVQLRRFFETYQLQGACNVDRGESKSKDNISPTM